MVFRIVSGFFPPFLLSHSLAVCLCRRFAGSYPFCILPPSDPSPPSWVINKIDPIALCYFLFLEPFEGFSARPLSFTFYFYPAMASGAAFLGMLLFYLLVVSSSGPFLEYPLLLFESLLMSSAPTWYFFLLPLCLPFLLLVLLFLAIAEAVSSCPPISEKRTDLPESNRWHPPHYDIGPLPISPPFFFLYDFCR